MQLDILDCTVRDGSYAIDFKWPLDKVVGIVGGLAENKFRYIEIGHGLGLGAERTHQPGCCSDLEYLEHAVAVKKDSLIGMFFIPGIGNFKDLDDFRRGGGGFVRIGTNVSETHLAEPYIKHAKNLGLEVSYNCMKSYAAKPFEFCRRMAEVAEWGTDAVYLVDSAGGMLPEEVAHYTRLLKQCIEIRIGFHGHNNLMLANASAVAAIQAGASMVDASLLGIGRGAGNAQTETLLIILQKMGYDLGIDPIPVLRLAEQYVKPVDGTVKGINHDDVIMGYALFHSSYLAMIQKTAEEFQVDPTRLVLAVADVNRHSPSEDLVRLMATRLKQKQPLKIFSPKFCYKKF